jgi:hypothetical protein
LRGAIFPEYYKSETLHEKTIHLLVRAGTFNGLVEETVVLQSVRQNAHLLDYLIKQIYPPYYDLPLKERLRVAGSIFPNRYDAAESLRIAFTPGGFAKESLIYTDMCGSTFLHYVTAKFARHCCQYISSFDKSSHHGPIYRDVNDPNNSWRRLIKEIIMAGAFLHAVNISKRSVLGNIIDAACWSSSDCPKNFFTTILQVIRIWLFDLQEAGIDLVCYGADEKALHLGGIVHNRFRSYLYACGDLIYIDLIAFTYGPRPEDWQFYFSEPMDFLVGEFWAVIEATACQDGLDLVEAAACHDEFDLPVPGSWIE